MPARLEPSGPSRSPTLHPHPQLERSKLSDTQRSLLTIPLTNLIAALAHRSMVKAFMEISTCTRCCDATRQRVQGWLGSKEVALLRRIFSNGGRDHGGQGTAVNLVALELQGEQEPSPCAARLTRLSGRGPHFRAGDGPGALSGSSGCVVTTAPPSRATVPPSQHARAIRASST